MNDKEQIAKKRAAKERVTEKVRVTKREAAEDRATKKPPIKRRAPRMWLTKEQMLEGIKACAKKLGRPPSLRELRRMKKITGNMVRQRTGTYREALALCGLTTDGYGCVVSERAVFEDWAGLVRRLGTIPTAREQKELGRFSRGPLIRLYRRWNRVPAGMLEYARREGLEEQWRDVMQIVASSVETAGGHNQRGGLDNATNAQAEPIYGTPLTLTSLTFAPTEEGGVMFLFGAMAKDLGFAVSRIQPAFPDCEAMREIRPGQWRRVRIEFEYESRNFLVHKHPVDGCDMIVCWKHNWENCPLEVLELRALVLGQRS